MNHNVIVMGASAGGVAALKTVCRGLPDDLPAALFAVLHVPPDGHSDLPDILSRVGPLKACHAVDGEEVHPGRIYVAPPDQHLMLADAGRRVMLRRGPRENRSRPAVDVLFRSAAVACGPQVIGIVLSGMLDDGAEGLTAIGRCGGITVVQDPADAEWPDMPRNAQERANADYCCSAAELPGLLSGLAWSSAGPAVPVPAELMLEVRISCQEIAAMGTEIATVGTPSLIGCPECGGVLNTVGSESSPRFRCQVGHAYSPKTLVADQTDALELALGVAFRTQRDRKTLFHSLERAAVQRHQTGEASRWRSAADEAQRSAELIATAIDTLRHPRLPRASE